MKKEKETKEYLEFVERFRAYIILVTEGWGAEVTFEKAGVTEGQMEDLLIVRLSGDGPGVHIQRFHMEDIYHDFKAGKDLDKLFSEAYDCMERCREIGRNSPLGRMEDYGFIRDYLILRPLNYRKNESRLQNGVYEVTGDIALTLYVNIGDFDGLYTSSMVPKTVFDGWNKSRAEVLQSAVENTYKLFPPRLFNWMDASLNQDENYGAFMDGDTEVRLEDGTCAIFVTTKNQINGAIAVFLPGVAKRLGEMMGSDLYIAFTSMHEAAIHHCGKVNAKTIRESLKGLNRDIPCEEDFLSDWVYYYSRTKDSIEVVPESV